MPLSDSWISFVLMLCSGTGVFLPPGTGVFLPVAEEGSSKGVSPKVVDSGTQYTAAAVEGPDSFDDLPASLMP